MNDRYLFRAKGDKQYNSGEWHEGFLIKDEDGDFQIFKNGCRNTVLPDTICQCTGIEDKNGNMIFEHDIVNCIEAGCYGEIIWNESETGFYLNVIYEDGTFGEERIYDYINFGMVVTGNIFDEGSEKDW